MASHKKNNKSANNKARHKNRAGKPRQQKKAAAPASVKLQPNASVVANSVSSPPLKQTPESAKPNKLIGLNIYRALAIFMMMAAHSIRIQSNFPELAQQRHGATWFDHFLLLFIDIEPIISAMFLFIAGFSLTLSFFKLKDSTQSRRWLKKIAQRATGLYGIAIIFFIAEYGLQWPDLLVSAGVLGTIGLSILLSAVLLVYGHGYKGLAAATVICLLVTYMLESEQWQVTGLNAGAGGHLPLVVMGFIGTLYGICYRHYGDNGLVAGLAVAAAFAILTMVIDYPNVFVYQSQFHWYAAAPEQQFIQSLLHLFSSEPAPNVRVAGFWNHASVFPLRYTVIIVLLLILAIKLIRQSSHRAMIFLNALGSYGLTIYVFHLVILAGLEVTGIKPTTGWQTLLLIFALMLAGYRLIRNRFHIDPDT